MVAAVLAVLPLVFIVIQVRDIGWSEGRRLLWRPRVGDLLLNTVKLTVTVTIACVIVGLIAAWLVERSDLPLSRTLGVLLVLPLAVPEYVNGSAWVSLFPGMHGFWAATFVMTLSHYPLVYLPTAAVLRFGDPALEESSRMLGRGRWRTFTRVTLPQVRLALLGGALIIALHLLAEYGGFAVLRYRTFATEIYASYRLGFDGGSAALLSLVLVVLCIVVLSGDLALRRHGRHDVAGAPTARRRRRARLGPARPLALLGIGGLVGLALAVPVGTLVYWMVRGSSTTLPSASIVSAGVNTLLYGAAASVLAVALALPVAFLAARRGGFVAAVLERTVFLPRALPGVVVGLALIFFSIRYTASLYQSPYILAIAYAILFMPLALVALQPTIARLTPALEESGRTLGSSPAAVSRRIVLPLILPGVYAAAALVFLSSATELTATLLLRPTGTETLATQFWLYTDGLAYGAAAPYAALMIAISAVPTLLLVRRLEGLSGDEPKGSGAGTWP